MKKKLCIVLIITIIITTSILFSSCIFRKGTLDEVYGIYGLTDAYYKYDGEVYRYGHYYKYFIIVIKEGGIATVMYQTVDSNASVVYDAEYSVKYDIQKNSRVESITIKNLKFIQYLPDADKTLKPNEVIKDNEGKYKRFQQNLDFNQLGLEYNEKLSGKSERIYFEKMYSKDSSKYINKAITKQENKIEDRKTGR